MPLDIDCSILDADRWLSTVPPDRRQALLARATLHAVSAGARVYNWGDPPDGLWVVIEGQLRLVSYPAVGVESVAMIMGPGAWFGELSTLDGGPRPHDAIAFSAAKLGHISPAAFEEASSRHPALWKDIARLLCARQRSALTFVAGSIAQPIEARLARALVATADATDSSALRIRQEDLAAMIGVSRQTIHRVLKRLQAVGLIARDYGQIRILDAARLRSASAYDFPKFR